MLLTRPQREAAKRLYDRDSENFAKLPGLPEQESYREFRQRVLPGSGCIMIPWCNMWMGIEPDGYTHS